MRGKVANILTGELRMLTKIAYVVLIPGIIFMAGFCLAESQSDVPRQFTTWAKYAPKDWRERSVPPKGWEEIDPKGILLGRALTTI